MTRTGIETEYARMKQLKQYKSLHTPSEVAIVRTKESKTSQRQYVCTRGPDYPYVLERNIPTHGMNVVVVAKTHCFRHPGSPNKYRRAERQACRS